MASKLVGIAMYLRISIINSTLLSPSCELINQILAKNVEVVYYFQKKKTIEFDSQ